MGRKIPGKKHRTIVDPEKQRAKRLESLKNKINNPPSNPNEQEVPRSLLKIVELKQTAKSNFHPHRKRTKRKRKQNDMPLCVEKFFDKDEMQPGMKKPERFIPNLVQRPQETAEGFLRRVNVMTHKLIKEVQFEDKFDVTIKKDLKTGEILQIEKNKGKKLSESNNSAKKTLSQKRKEKKKVKIEKENGKDFNQLKDVVEFGEVVHRPPVNLKLPKKVEGSVMKKKDKYKDLLLQGIINNKDKSKKSEIQLMKEEKQRQFIVNAYRERKKFLKM